MIEKLKAIFQPKVKEARFQVFDNENGYTDGIPQPDKYGDMTQSFSAHSWVYAAASTIASNLASLDFKPYQLKKDGTWEDAPENELYRVLQKPNAYMSATNLREFTVLNLDLTGNGYIALERGGTKNILEAWPLPAAYVKPVSKPDRFIDHYVYEVNGKQIKYAYDEIIHFRYANPVEFKYGQGSITALKNSIAADLYADAWNRFFFQNSARPDSILETEGTLDPATRDRIRESWKAMFQGSKKRGKTALLEAGVKYKEINRTPKDLDFLALRKNAREEILGAMGVPPSMVGILEYANYANLKEQTQIFWKHTILPKARAFADTLTLRAGQLTGDDSIVFQPETSNVEALRADENQRAQTAKIYADMGIPVNQIIDALDLPFEEIEGGDVPHFPSQQQVAVTADQQPAQQDAGQQPEGKAVRSKSLDENRVMIWKQFDNALSRHEDTMRSAMRGFFKKQKARVLKEIIDNKGKLLAGTGLKGIDGLVMRKDIRDTMRVIFNLNTENEDLRKSSEGIIKGTYVDFALSAGRKINPTFDFTTPDHYAIDWITNKATKLSQDINSNTLESISDEVVQAVHDAVAQGYSESETIADIASRIDDVYQFAVETRAERIARTEIIGASNAGAIDGMKKNGATGKEWLATPDAKTRDTHAALNGTVVKMGEPFEAENGAKLMFPGDPGADVGEIVNCRCTVLSVFE